MAKVDYVIETKSTQEQVANREKLYDLFDKRPMSDVHFLSNMGMYMRSSALVKLLFLNEVYEAILNVPGDIVEFGIWWGQNLCVFENLRAIYEPFNKSRHVIGFDTFQGYDGFTKQDVQDEVMHSGGYSVSNDYQSYLQELLSFHESNNVQGNIRNHKLVKGNVIETVPDYYKNNPHAVIALAYVDLGIYEPCKVCFEIIKSHVVPGSVILLDELNSDQMPGETIAFREVFKDVSYELKNSKFLPDRTMMIIR